MAVSNFSLLKSGLVSTLPRTCRADVDVRYYDGVRDERGHLPNDFYSCRVLLVLG